jgi:TolB-like protein/tetratricopeptide (TPR) repeat protein/predicted Ser/Thr protein kinase
VKEVALIGRRLGHYQITAAIGAGGMGEVYRAADTKLGRDVALKVLLAPMARDPEFLARFKREARAVAALNDPHIVTIYSVEEAEGIHFLTMELVEGPSLKTLIAESGLAVERIVEIGAALAEALAAAHEKGIVHRDLKPANIMVTADGRVKVLDFGLAKDSFMANSAGATATSADYTKVGMVMGTPAYMSPEQVAGRAIDHRTDIFSLGIVLYEMTSGRRPFLGSSPAALASAIQCDAPPPLSELRGDLPEELELLIHHCLEKSAGERFSSARELCGALREVPRGSSSSRRPAGAVSRAAPADSGAARAEEGFWTAVLPFKYSGASAEVTALAEGLTEEIVIGLSRFSYLRVIALSSTKRYAHEEVDVRRVGKELGARYVMEGSLRQSGSKLRIAVQLVDTNSGAHLWAETYDCTFNVEDVFALQDDVVPKIVSTVADTYGILPHTMSEILRDRPPEQLTPYEAVLRSFAHFPRLAGAEHAAARSGLERAVQQAPGYADAWAMLSMVVREEHTHGFNVLPDTLGRAMAAARRAVEIAPSNHLAYHALASAQFFRREVQAFRISAERAIALNPMDGFTAAYLGFLIAYSGDWERGCALAVHARRLNPHHPGWYWFGSFFDAYRKCDYRGALDYALKVSMPGFWRTSMALAIAYGQLGEIQAAHKAARDLLAVRPDFPVIAREELGKWWDPELVEHLIDGLRNAGMEIASKL